jgi:hypothetical protein
MNIREGFIDDKTPDMKYYAFDWDDNIVYMPTNIIVKNEDGDEIGMGTEDFAKYRHIIGKEPFVYKGEEIVGFAERPFRNFKEEGDKDFIIDAMEAETGPAFDDFREAINNASIFSIITARGHDPETLKTAVENYIINNFNGINKDEMIKNLKKYRDFAGEDEMTDDELIKYYLDLNKYYPVTFGDETGAVNPENAKIDAMQDFILHVKKMAKILDKKAFIRNKVSNNFTPTIGFSDDDIANVTKMRKAFEKEPELIKTYVTTGGIKKKYN